MSIRNVLNNLDLVISKKDQILRRPDIGTIIIKEAGISANKHIPFTLDNLVRLWTENTRWKIKHNGHSIYIYKIKMIDYKFNIVAYGWDETLQKPIKLNGLSYQQLFNDAVKVGVRPPNSTVKLNDAIEVLRG
ncbi:MAG: hypothetical protein IJZ30_02830 [Alphaproteobacteria bacterium]|nr:hypothetical protein [Alphaproteobacteria bacterium]